MRRHAKASSAGPIEGTANSRDLLRRALATRGASRGSKGSGAPAAKLLGLLAISLIALFASAAPALAAPPSTSAPVLSDVSYTSVKVSGTLTTPAEGLFPSTFYTFQYSTDNANWVNGPSGFVFGAQTNLLVPETPGAIENLEGGTHYYVRLTANYAGQPVDQATSPLPNPEFTTLVADPPTIPGAVAATDVFSTSAKAFSEVRRPASSDDVKCHFEYISDAQFTENEGNSLPGFEGAASLDCEQNPIEQGDADTDKEVFAHLAGLSPATAYHLRLVAENSSGPVVKDAASTFTTEPKVAKPTVVSIKDATDVTLHEATVEGKVQRPAGDDPALNVECRFEYVTQAEWEANSNSFPAGAPSTPCAENPIATQAAQEVSAQLGGLIPDKTYHLRLAAENGGGVDSKEADNTFLTLPAEKPAVTIDPVPGGTYTTAHVTGTVDIDDPGKTIAFPYIEVSTDGGATWPNGFSGERPTVNGPGPHVVEKNFTGLQPNTTYTFRIKANYGGNPDIAEARGEMAFSPGPNPSITTGELFPPTAKDLAVTGPTATTAHFSASVDPHAPAGLLSELGKKAFATHWEFVCAPACKDANGNAIAGTVQAEAGAQTIAGDAKRLDPNTHYSVSLIIASEGGGETIGPVPFDTPLVKPTVKAALGGSDGKGGYTLQGIVNPNNSPVTDCEFKWGPNSAELVFSVDCSPMPEGRDEVQSINVNADGGQFKLTYNGQSTVDLPFNASAAEVQAALEALPQIGPGSVAVTGAWTVTFQGSLSQVDAAQITIQDGTVPLSSSNPGGNAVSKSTKTNIVGGNSSPVTVEAHLTGLTPDTHYHFNLFATNAAGTEESGVEEFVPTLSPAESCPNEQVRTENSSLALPECRAYEKVTPDGKEGFGALLTGFSYGNAVSYQSGAGNLAKSGQNALNNYYVATRTKTGWETIPNLNGASGSIWDAPSNLDIPVPRSVGANYSKDLLSSLWFTNRRGDPVAKNIDGSYKPNVYLRHPDGTFTLISPTINASRDFSDDLSHLLLWTSPVSKSTGSEATGDLRFGPGVYEFVGTGSDQPRRVDVDNFGDPASSCTGLGSNAPGRGGESISRDGRVAFFTVFGGCGGANPPANEIGARIDGTVSVAVSASQCNRTAPADPCNLPSKATFEAAASDGSRVFFTTTQQLVDGDTDQTTDIYACDIPSGTPTPVGNANPCAAFRQVSVADAGAAEVENVLATSDDGSAVYFTAKGVLADNEDAFGEQAFLGDHNVYVWRTDADHPAGQTTFLARLDSNDLEGSGATTPDGRYLIFTTASQLVTTDSDTARDVYRYDVENRALTRASTNVFGVAGNGAGFDAGLPQNGDVSFFSASGISDDGQKIVFTTREALAPADGNAEPDAYLWTSDRVFLISPGSVGSAAISNSGGPGRVSIDGSGQDVYFETSGALTPADGDGVVDVYDARIGGGFSFAQAAPCSGEACQPDPAKPLVQQEPRTISLPPDPGNVKPKHCPKGKVLKGKKCVKKKHGKHHGKKHHGKKAAHKRGGGK